ncbi:aspartate aminotransferase [Candidatus Beckwithbacteria bacterium CG1_02_47_37]|uniref:Aminotransferase n=4 Tax=Candidatus Beckwithiibacteriota TaxID=1752726 RepID=A0A1J4RQA1_9BACT|nr:MAG: aspartate aminotransferase [Candidatus Beckwithbacteria bacterium CG1_02_47_37]
MPNISLRDRYLAFSPIRKLTPYAEAAKKRGVKIYHLNIGQPDIASPQIFLDKVKEFNQKTVAYEKSDGSEELKSSLLKYYRGLGISLTTEDLLVTTGGSEALMWLFFILFEPGQECLTFEPTYTNYVTFAELAGVNLRPITTFLETNFTLPSIEQINRAITKKTRAIIVTNPNNPTGAVYSRNLLEELVELCLKRDIFIIADETYREFIYGGTKAVPLLTFKKAEQIVVLADSLSKRYSLCGARLGCMVSKNQPVMTTANKIAQARLASPTIEQYAASFLDQVPESYFREVNQEYLKRRDFLISELKKIPDVKVSRPDGAFYLIAQLPVVDAEDFCRFMLEEFADRKETVMLAPAEGFYLTPGMGVNQVRIAYVLKRPDLKRAVELIALGLLKYKNEFIRTNPGT